MIVHGREMCACVHASMRPCMHSGMRSCVRPLRKFNAHTMSVYRCKAPMHMWLPEKNRVRACGCTPLDSVDLFREHRRHVLGQVRAMPWTHRWHIVFVARCVCCSCRTYTMLSLSLNYPAFQPKNSRTKNVCPFSPTVFEHSVNAEQQYEDR